MWIIRTITGLASFAGVIALLYVLNASFWSEREGALTLLAHRGLAQTYTRDGLTNDTCTATRIHTPEHPYLENTIASMRAAFGMGADIVELDVHPTRDGQFAVFHDWRLECRTNGRGVTREQTMTHLKTLDIGHGYTADGGKSFPFRGQFIGAMPELGEVFEAFPGKRFLINVKSNDAEEGRLLAARLSQHSASEQALLMAYGGDEPMRALREALPNMRVMSKAGLRRCVLRYLGTGWYGRVPKACRNTLILVPSNTAFLLWGWPNRFLERMERHNSQVFVVGPLDRAFDFSGTSGVDSHGDLEGVGRAFTGGVWTNRIDRASAYFGRAVPPADAPVAPASP